LPAEEELLRVRDLDLVAKESRREGGSLGTGSRSGGLGRAGIEASEEEEEEGVNKSGDVDGGGEVGKGVSCGVEKGFN